MKQLFKYLVAFILLFSSTVIFAQCDDWKNVLEEDLYTSYELVQKIENNIIDINAHKIFFEAGENILKNDIEKLTELTDYLKKSDQNPTIIKNQIIDAGGYNSWKLANGGRISKKVLKLLNVDDIGKASISKFSLVDEAGNVTGELKRVIGKGGEEVRYFYTDFKGGNRLIKNQQYKMSPVEVPNYEILDPTELSKFEKMLGKDILYGDLQMPKVVNDNVSGLGKIMSDDAYKLLDSKVDIDGFYGVWKKDAVLYADYGGESINLTKFKDAIGKGMTKEEAAFETITGKVAKEKGFNDVKFNSDFDIKNLDEVHIIFLK